MRKVLGLGLICSLSLGFPVQAQSKDDIQQCSGVVSSEPEQMYDFKLGEWKIAWKNQTKGNDFFEFGAVSKVYKIMGGDISIDEQTSDFFKGITYRTYDRKKEEWVVRWLPANSTFGPNISAKLENCIPVERHKQMAANGQLADVRTSFTNITDNSFEFHQDWSYDQKKTWTKDVLFYEATRENKE